MGGSWGFHQPARSRKKSWVAKEERSDGEVHMIFHSLSTFHIALCSGKSQFPDCLAGLSDLWVQFGPGWWVAPAGNQRVWRDKRLIRRQWFSFSRAAAFRTLLLPYSAFSEIQISFLCSARGGKNFLLPFGAFIFLFIFLALPLSPCFISLIKDLLKPSEQILLIYASGNIWE